MTLAMAYGIQAGASIVGGLFGRSAAKKKAKAAKAMAQYNANVIRANAKSEADAVEFSARRLAKEQREIQALSRMSIASRGATLSGTDLSTYLNQMEEMQLDQLELQRQADIATITGEQKAQGAIYQGQQQASIARAEGRAALAKGVLGAASAYAGFKGATN
jgi:hypothetical protein